MNRIGNIALPQAPMVISSKTCGSLGSATRCILRVRIMACFIQELLIYVPSLFFESCVFSDSSHTTSGSPFFEKVATRSGETMSYLYTLWFCLVCHVLKLLLYNGFHFSEIIFRRDILNTVSLCHEQNWNFLLIQ